MNTVNLSRRKFLKSSAIVGGGLVVGFSMTGCAVSNPSVVVMPGGLVPNAFVQITPDNQVRFYCPRDEMGQGVTTGLGTLVAEELDVDPQVLIVSLPGAHSDYKNPLFGMQGTGGSSSVSAHFQQLRQAGANVRSLLIEAASMDLQVPRADITTRAGHIVVQGKEYPYGQFVATATSLAMPEEAPLKAMADFRYIGTTFPRLDALAKSTGTAEYGVDIDIPGLHHAVVRRSPVAGARLASCDKSAAEKMPGVVGIFEISSGVAVVAEKYWQAKMAAAALLPQWQEVALSKVDSKQVRADYASAMVAKKGVATLTQGDVANALEGATTVVEHEYWAPYLAHAPMEPLNAVLRIENGQADLWSGTQGPGIAQGLVARFSGLDAENVRVHSPYMGGAFGRRGTLTHIVEVTEIVMAANKPVKLLWSREDDIRHGVYRPASLMKIKAGLDAEGNIDAWQAKRVGGNITPETLKNMLPGLFPGLPGAPIDFMVGLSKSAFKSWVVDPASVEGLAEDYNFPHRSVHHVTVDHGVPLTFWRSVGHSFTAFAKETMMDELALAAGMDVVDFRLQNSTANPRLNNVIKVAGEQMRQMQPPAGHYLGFAAHSSFLTDVAQIAEVSIADGVIKVHKVTCVLDCGIAVNPDVVRAQVEGAIMFGLTAALHGDMELVDGAFKESNFHDYQILRMNEAPAVDVVIIASQDAPTGVGEPGLPPVAPAVANAVFAATGQRLRSLPLKLA
jgi:isoquinoline 1-oxidoreductase subunit beta